METVVTVGGLEVPKVQCRAIAGKYYIIGDSKVYNSGECYRIESTGKYYRADSQYIIWNHTDNCYIDSRVIPLGYAVGIVDDYTHDVAYNPVGMLNLITNAGLRKVTPTYKGDFEYDERVDAFIAKGTTDDRIRRAYENQPRVRYNKFDVGLYGLNGSSSEETLYESGELIEEGRFENLSKLLGGLTFGVEIETESGYIPEAHLLRTGFAPLKDGSIGGLEYVSIPGGDASQLERIVRFSEAAKLLCTVGDRTSLHIHVGNILPKSNYSDQEFKVFTLAMWMLTLQVQQEMFDIIPNYKNTYRYWNSKNGMNHCQFLPNLTLFDNNIFSNGKLDVAELDKYFNIIFRFMNDGQPADRHYNPTTRRHRKHDGSKWHINSRYYSVNFYNLLFSNSKTVEFRTHSGTVNPIKIINWILIVNSLVRYAKKYTKEIINREIKVNLKDVLSELGDNFGEESNEYNRFVAKHLTDYVTSRKEHFLMARMDGDNYASEFDRDCQYTFGKENLITKIK